MKKIIPFKKDITFDDYIYEISSISLEHTLSLKDEYLISGNFTISGSYKMTEASINTCEFNYNLPFDITIDTKYDTKEALVDINDFYYEVIDGKVLSINIEVVIDGLLEREIKMKDEIKVDDENVEVLDEALSSNLDRNTEDEIVQAEDSRDLEEVTSVFDDFNSNEKYVTYKVHIVSENDTLESIIQKYQTSMSKLSDYNNLSDIKIGDKIIIQADD